MLSRKEMARQRAGEIYRVASRVLCELGYDRASVRDLARATGLTKAGLYYYFKSKEELLFIILNGYMDELLAGVGRIAERVPGPEERLKAFIGFQVEQYCNDTHRSKLIIHDENCLSGQWLLTVKDKQRRYLAYWAESLTDFAHAKGLELANLSAEVMLLTGMCNWIYQWYQPEGPIRPTELADLIYTRYTRGLDAESAARRPSCSG